MWSSLDSRKSNKNKHKQNFRLELKLPYHKKNGTEEETQHIGRSTLPWRCKIVRHHQDFHTFQVDRLERVIIKQCDQTQVITALDESLWTGMPCLIPRVSNTLHNQWGVSCKCDGSQLCKACSVYVCQCYQTAKLISF